MKMNRKLKQIAIIVSSIIAIVGIVKFGDFYRVYEEKRVLANEIKEEKEKAITLAELEQMNKDADEKFIQDSMIEFKGKRNKAKEEYFFKEVEVGLDADFIDLTMWGKPSIAFNLNSNLITINSPIHKDYYKDVYFLFLDTCDYPYQYEHQVLVMNGEVVEVVKSVKKNLETDYDDMEHAEEYKFCINPKRSL
jgi:hypothetical protein